MRERIGRTATMTRVLIVALVATVATVGVGCVPSEQGALREVDDGTDSAAERSTAPEFPATGVVPEALLVDGIVFDLSDRPTDMDYWAPPTAEARCAAQRIVDEVGAPRLSELGYRSGTPGASLNDVDLTDTEQAAVIAAVEECVDMEEALASIFYGDGRMSSRAATCLARSLTSGGLVGPFTLAFASGEAIDPFADDGALASGMLSGAAACVADSGFNWPDVRLSDEDQVINSDLPAGSSNSPYVDDRPQDGSDTSAPTTSAP